MIIRIATRSRTATASLLKTPKTVVLALICSTAVPAAYGTSPASPSSLRVNNVNNPVGTDAVPYFGWHVNDADRDEIQTAYQILVASTEANLDCNIGDFWDSGMVASRKQNHVVYSGSPLVSDARYFWKVRTWDKDDSPGSWSAPAAFTVGLNVNSNWTGACWIKRSTTDADDYTYYRKLATLPAKTIKRATAYISSVHKYDLYINGTLVGKGPAYHYPQYQYYNAYDITPFVQADAANQFAIFNHWFGGGQGRPAGERGLIMKAIIHYTDGSSTVIITDGSWRQAQATAWSLSGLTQRQAGEGMGYVEKIEAAKLIPERYTLAFDDSSWSTATVIGTHPVAPWTGALAPDLSRISETVIAPASITDMGSGKYVVDLGKVYAGIPRIKFSGGTSNTIVNMRGGYVLNGSGEIDTAFNQSTDMSYYAILNGGTFTYEPAEYLGMRYFQIDNAPMEVTKDHFEFIERHSEMDTEASSFTSADPTLNAVWDLMKHSILTCAQEEFVDTPTREKGGFLGDAAIQSMVAMPVMNERMLTRRVLGEFLQSMDQHWSTPGDAGRMNAVYPNKDGARDIPDYTQAYLVWTWNYYMESGDLDFLTANYEKLKDIADYVYVYRNNRTGLISNLAGGSGAYQYGIVDWPATMRFGYDMTYARTVINGWAYADFDVLAKIAEELGNTTDNDTYRARADALKDAMNSQLINDSGVYVDGLNASDTPSTHVSQHANMFPLALGIVPNNNTVSVVNKIKDLEMSVGMVTLPWLIRAIGEADEGEHLVKLFTNESWNGWAHCLARGATATWESWDADTTGQSMSHAWGAAGLEGYVRYILGIKPLKPQYEMVQINPLDFGTALPSASGTITTDRGEISVEWQNNSSSYSMQICVPVNMTADIAVLKGDSADPVVYLDGIATAGADDGQYIWIKNVGSGTHTIIRADPSRPASLEAPKHLPMETIRVDAPFEMPPITIPDFSNCPEFSIINFGAKPENKKSTTRAITKAIDQASKASGGVVVIPDGEWITGSIHLKSNINLHLEEDAVLVFSENPDDYLPAVQTTWEGMECFNYSPLIYAFECQNVAITGKGKLRAKLDIWKTWYSRPAPHMEALKRLYTMATTDVPVEDRKMVGNAAHLRPQFIQFNRCENILIEGISIENIRSG